ncbi:unnamed protein product, partial [Ectocarpus sp. 8 AP-2014]
CLEVCAGLWRETPGPTLFAIRPPPDRLLESTNTRKDDRPGVCATVRQNTEPGGEAKPRLAGLAARDTSIGQRCCVAVSSHYGLMPYTSRVCGHVVENVVTRSAGTTDDRSCR